MNSDNSAGGIMSAHLNHYLKDELYQLFQHDPLFLEVFQCEILDGIWYWDLENLENEWMSENFWLSLGYDPSEKMHLASEWKDIINQEDLAVATDNFKRHLEDPSCPYDQYVRYLHKNGSTVWIRCRGVAVHNEQGEAIRFLGCHMDVTNLMQRQERLVKAGFKANQLAREKELIALDLMRERSVNEALELRLKQSEQVDSVTQLLTNDCFLQEAEKLKCMAVRLKHNLSLFTFSIDNSDYISATFGANELTAKLIQLKDIAQKTVCDSLATSFEESSVTLLTVGYDLYNLSLAYETFVENVKKRSWSLIAPEVSVSFTSEMPRLDDTEQIESLLVTGSQMRL